MIKLYEQALEFTYDNVSKEIWNTDNFHAIVAGKFAELIIKESIKVMMENDYHGEWLGEKLKEHFGVRE